jgi:hypothetical protein
MRKREVIIYNCKTDKERPKDGDSVIVRYYYNWHKALYYAKDDTVMCDNIQANGRVPFIELNEWHETMKPEPLDYNKHKEPTDATSTKESGRE